MTTRTPLAELATLFLRLGVTAFGGPAAHIAMMRDEVVDRRKWLTDAEFLDLLAATNLIPGPNSTEMAIHLGYRRAGLAGLALAGVCFILPAALIVLPIAWAYARYGETPQAAWLAYGIAPVIIANRRAGRDQAGARRGDGRRPCAAGRRCGGGGDRGRERAPAARGRRGRRPGCRRRAGLSDVAARPAAPPPRPGRSPSPRAAPACTPRAR